MITKKTNNTADLDFESGEVILVDKEFRKTSFNVIHEIRKVINVRKVGHAGTLDPYATGLLIVCTGKMTKSISQFQEFEKTYVGSFKLGQSTPSMDAETEPSEEKSLDSINTEMIFNTAELFKGKILQKPPIYSAIKYKGKALYHYARKGKEVEIKEREVFISDFFIEKIELPLVFFKISCSKGTYIRVIANDFGNKLGCGAYLNSLRRIRIGEYSVDDALLIKEFKENFSKQIIDN